MSKAAKKRILSLTLALCLMFGMAAMTWAEEGENQDGGADTTENTSSDGEEDDDDEADNEDQDDEDSEDGDGEETDGEDEETEGANVTMTAPTSAPVLGRSAGETINFDSQTFIQDAAAAANWQINGNVVELNGPGPFTITGSTSDYCVQAIYATVAVTLSGVNIDADTNTLGVAAFDCNGNDVTVTLAGTNTLLGDGRPGLQCESSASVTIGGGGSLTATGGLSAAGIGGGQGGGGKVTINSGTVTANGNGNGAAGIGGGQFGGGGDVTVNGGTVTASGGALAHAIGSGVDASGGSLTIRDGEVNVIAYPNGYHVNGTVLFLGEATLQLSGTANGNRSLDVETELGSAQWVVTGGSITTGGATDQVIEVQVPANTPASIELKALPASVAALQSVAGQTINTTGGVGTSGYPFAAAISLGYDVDSVSTGDLVASQQAATAALFDDASYANPLASLPLAAGENNLYIKVTSADGSAERYYRVTATRAQPGQYSVTVTSNPAGGGNPTATPNPAAQDGTVTLTANPVDGYTFSRWVSASPGVVIDSPTQPTTTFTMPGNSVEVVAYYTRTSGSGGAVSSGGSSRSGSGDGGGNYTVSTTKTQLPASAFSWSGRTLTINNDSITPLGLTKVLWDGVETDAFSKYSGSVVIRFDQDFIDSQSTGSHTVRVEFLNHYGETTVTLGQTGTQTQPGADNDAPVLTASTNDNMNPSTGR